MQKGGDFMETVNMVLQAITTVGFPIVCCGVLMYYVKYIRDKDTEMMAEIMARHSEEVNTMSAALNENTLVLQKLCDKLDSGVNVDG